MISMYHQIRKAIEKSLCAGKKGFYHFSVRGKWDVNKAYFE
jgi:hypothetical protein